MTNPIGAKRIARVVRSQKPGLALSLGSPSNVMISTPVGMMSASAETLDGEFPDSNWLGGAARRT